MSSALPRLQPGETVAPRRLQTVTGAAAAIPDPDRLVHLQFRRFAGCPVCTLHLDSFARAASRLSAAGVRELVVFHSTADALRPHLAGLPFDVVADPERHLYAEFGVEAAPRALLDPRAWLPILRAIAVSASNLLHGRRPAPPVVPDGGRVGLPADILIANDGRVLACRYGEHVDDDWSVDQVLTLAQEWHSRGQPIAVQAMAERLHERRTIRATTRAALAALSLTSVHHVYGAFAYATPWRLHVVPIALAAGAGMLYFERKALGGTTLKHRRTAAGLLALLVFAVSFALFGVFEGGYNHVLKNLLYVAGTPASVLHVLFPPPTYVLPDDAFFEVSGILQTFPALLSGAGALTVLRRLWPTRATRASTPAGECDGCPARATQ